MNKEVDNKNLYESDEVVTKYVANTTRARSLNNADRALIDRFNIKNKKVLVLGCGAGRVPVNLLLFGNEVVGVDRSERLLQYAKETFPKTKFRDLDFLLADMCDLSSIHDEIFDVIIFPMNSIDYIDTIEMREKAINEAYRKLKHNGIFAMSSHNKLAYLFSPKLPMKSKSLKYLFNTFLFDKEKVIGGGLIFKGNPEFIINEVEKSSPLTFLGFTVDSRNKIERFLARNINTAKYIFPYIFYVFKKA